MIRIRVAIFASLALSSAAIAQTHPRPVLLVVNKQSHTLAMVDPDTFRVLATAPVGEDPHEVVVGPDNRSAFISNFGEGTLHTIARVDLVRRRAMPSIDLAPLKGAHGLAVQGDRLWFTAVGSKAVGSLNPSSGKVSEIVGTGQDNTHMIWVAQDGGRVIASNAGSGTISAFKTVTHRPGTIAGAPPPPERYTYRDWRQTLVPVGPAAEGFAVSPDGREAWVGSADGIVSIIDVAAAKVVATIAGTPLGANRLAFTPDGKTVIMTTHTGKDLIVFDAPARTVKALVPIEQRGASGIQIAPDGTRAFIACPRDHYVAVVDLVTLRLAGKIETGREPDGLAWWQP